MTRKVMIRRAYRLVGTREFKVDFPGNKNLEKIQLTLGNDNVMKLNIIGKVPFEELSEAEVDFIKNFKG